MTNDESDPATAAPEPPAAKAKGWLARATEQLQQAGDTVRATGEALGSQLRAQVSDRVMPRASDAYDQVLRRVSDALARPAAPATPAATITDAAATDAMATDAAGTDLPAVGAEGPAIGAVVPGAGALVPGAGAVVPGAGAVVPDAGAVVPGAGAVVPDAGAVVPDAGAVVPGAGAVVPGAGAVVPAQDDPVAAARLTDRFSTLVKATDWAAVSRQASTHKDEVSARARELLRHVDWQKAGPQATRLAVALAIGAAAGEYGAAVDEGSELVTLLLTGHRNAVNAGAQVAAQVSEGGAPQLAAAAELMNSPEAEEIARSLTAAEPDAATSG